MFRSVLAAFVLTLSCAGAASASPGAVAALPESRTERLALMLKGEVGAAAVLRAQRCQMTFVLERAVERSFMLECLETDSSVSRYFMIRETLGKYGFAPAFLETRPFLIDLLELERTRADADQAKAREKIKVTPRELALAIREMRLERNQEAANSELARLREQLLKQ